MAYNAMRGGIEVDDSQVGLILSWCDVDQLGELFFPDFALAFYMLVVIASQQKPLGVGDTAQLRAEVSRKVTQLTGGCTRRQFLERQKAQQSRETEDHKNRYGSQTEDDDFDDTIRPDDLVTQVPVKRKRRKRRDRTSQPANEVPSTIKPTVNGREDSDKSLRMAVNHESHSGRSIASTPSGSFNSSRSATSDLVRDSKLETVISNNGALVQHISYESNPRMRQRRLRKEQTWKRVRELGGGGFGCVWLEERLNGDDGGGTFRAVKEISKIQPQGQHISINYNRELEAIAKFSHSKVRFFSFFSLLMTVYLLFPPSVLVRTLLCAVSWLVRERTLHFHSNGVHGAWRFARISITPFPRGRNQADYIPTSRGPMLYARQWFCTP
jgi:hypothetical protein